MDRSTRRTTRALAAAAVVIPAALLTAPAPAQAAGGMTLWADDGYKGIHLTRSVYDSDYHNDKFCENWRDGTVVETSNCHWSLRFDFGDRASSVKNDSPYYWKLFSQTDYKGYVVCVRPYSRDNDLGNNTDIEDKISSAERYGTTQPRACDKTIGY